MRMQQPVPPDPPHSVRLQDRLKPCSVGSRCRRPTHHHCTWPAAQSHSTLCTAPDSPLPAADPQHGAGSPLCAINFLWGQHPRLYTHQLHCKASQGPALACPPPLSCSSPATPLTLLTRRNRNRSIILAPMCSFGVKLEPESPGPSQQEVTAKPACGTRPTPCNPPLCCRSLAASPGPHTQPQQASWPRGQPCKRPEAAAWSAKPSLGLLPQ